MPASEVDQRLDQPRTHSATACMGLDEEHPQAPEGGQLTILALGNEHDRAESLAAGVGDPQTFPPRIPVRREIAQETTDERLKPMVESMHPPVERAMALEDPTEITGTMLANRQYWISDRTS